ncbi:MAG TPA: hypothetical protein VF258_00090, partial [Luteolibacter sp.]
NDGNHLARMDNITQALDRAHGTMRGNKVDMQILNLEDRLPYSSCRWRSGCLRLCKASRRRDSVLQ